MHEMSLAEALWEQVLSTAERYRLKKIQEVEVEAGALKQIVPELLQTAFTALTEGTIGQGAELTITEIKASAQCRDCHQIFEPQLNDFLCPGCHRANVDILSGEQFILKTVIGQNEEGPSPNAS